MSEETEEKLVMPRRPEKRKPAPRKNLRKKDQGRDEVEEASEMLSVDERACALLCTEYSPETAATTLGWTLAEVHDTLAQPHVRLFLKKADERFIIELAKAKVRRLNKVGISRAAIENRLFELMNMDPSDTKGSIEGQVKAGIALAKCFGYAEDDDPLEDMTTDELKEVVSKGHRMIEGVTGKPVN